MARLGTPHCPECQTPLVHQGLQIITDTLLKKYKGRKISILAPIVVSRKGEYRKEIAQKLKEMALFVYELTAPSIERKKQYNW